LEKKLKEDLKFATIPVDWNPVADANSHHVTLFPVTRLLWFLNEGVKVTGNVLLTSEILMIGKDLGITNAVGVDSKGRKKKSLYYLSKR
jgi:hypothetical protein